MADIISNDAVREIITIASQQGILSQKDVDNTIAHSNETGKPMSSILFERSRICLEHNPRFYYFRKKVTKNHI